MGPDSSPTERRTFLRLLGAGLAGTALGASGSTNARAANGSWPMFGHDARLTYWNPTATGPTDDPEVRWRYTAETASVNGLTVRDGTAFLPVRGTLFGVDLTTGEQTIGRSVDGLQGTLLFGGEGRAFSTGSGTVRAFDPSDWSPAWEQSLDRQPIAPIASDRYVAVGSTQNRYAVLDEATGEVALQGEVENRLTLPPVLDGDRAFVGGRSGTRAFSLRTGEEVWRTESSFSAPFLVPTLTAGRFVVSGGESIRAYDPGDGTEVWSREVGGTTWFTATDETLYAIVGDTLTALSARTGDEQWTTTIESSSPRTAGGSGQLYTVTQDTLQLRAYDQADGSLAWEVPLVEDPEDVTARPSTPIPVGNSVLVLLAGSQDDRPAELIAVGRPEPTPTPTPEETPTAAVQATTRPEEDRAAAVEPSGGPFQSLTGGAGLPIEILLGVGGGTGLLLGALGLRSVVAGGDDPEPTEGPDDADPSTASGDGDDSPDDAAGGGTTTAASYSPPADGTAAAAFASATGLPVTGSLSEDGPVHRYEGQYDGEPATYLALAPDVDAADAFEGVATRWAGISSDRAVTTVYETGTDPRPWLAAERRGRPLSAVEGAVTLSAAERVFEHVVDALTTGRRYNVQHHGLTPDCVGLFEDDDGTAATVSDWGLTRAVHEAVGDAPVTPYTAPEQLPATADTVGRATDVYAAGAVGYYLLTGRPPFASTSDLADRIREGDVDPASEASQSLPEDVDDVLAKAMARQAADRYDSPTELRDRLRLALD
ncbi:PQQ-binding-like beta-propeller repeat protein [Haloarcula litorea]|uniref:outer membrane protein assembly factor BamB family protein n=1 Tax=Haloarcula litorea TaxID=3032579 RepID=UPI0023E8744A|nr:PQQ-binding-like beta-propeller repeat protein [Halomicroarcula sp. GDY20]